METLRAYIQSRPGGQAAFARRLGITPSFVSQWFTGLREVPLHIAIDIEKETQGAVRVEELRPDVDWSVIRAKPSKAAA